MNRRNLLAVVSVLVFVVLVGTGTVITFVGTGPDDVGMLLDDTSDPPALLYFESAGTQCTEDFIANSSTSVVAGSSNTQITYSRNVSMPGPSYVLGGPTFEQINESTYVLNIPIEETEKAPRSCQGVAHYNGTMRIPAGDDPWNLIIKHNGEQITKLYGDSNQTLLGGSAGVGQRVSDSESTANSTTAAI